MNCDERKSAPKKSILNKFKARRSCRVEPHPVSDGNESDNVCGGGGGGTERFSSSAKSTPARKAKHSSRLTKIWRCYYSMQSVSSSAEVKIRESRELLRAKPATGRSLDNRKSYPGVGGSSWREPDAENGVLYRPFVNAVDALQLDDDDDSEEHEELLKDVECVAVVSERKMSFHGSIPDLKVASTATMIHRARIRDRLLSRKSHSIDNHAMLEEPSITFDEPPSVGRPFPRHLLSRTRTESSLPTEPSIASSQCINLIPTELARERNNLAARLSINSLMGPSELDRVLPAREIRVFVGTWNMNGQHPPNGMDDFVLPAAVEHVPDVIAIGTQESCSERCEWEVVIQETIGPSHVLFHSTYLGTLHLAIFIRRDLIWFCSLPEDDCLSVRPGTAFRTKGAIAISFCLFGTSLLFVTSHLTAHQQKVKERVSDVKRIIHSLDLPKNLHLRCKNRDVTQNFDAVFWCGDLNFRLGEPREKLLKWIENTQFPLPAHLPNGYMHTDQLKSVLANGAAFKDFKEAEIRFPPTYKYDPGTQKFDTSSKQRAPAYTDRILYKYKSNPFGMRRDSQLTSFRSSPMIENVAYDSVPSIVSSDHKPVWALFKVAIKPGIDSIPLAAGLFNREVYVEGMKRRISKTHTDSSNACCIQ